MKKIIVSLLILTGCVLAKETAIAGLSVSPVNVMLAAPERSTELRVSVGKGDSAAQISLQALEWTQVNGQDVERPSSQLLIYPTKATVAPGRPQIFRLFLSKPRYPNYYRILVKDVTAVTSADAQLKIKSGFSIPVFVEAADMQPKILAQWTPAGLLIANQGNGYDRLEAIQSTQKPVSSLQSQYLLPGTQVILPLKSPKYPVVLKTRRAGYVEIQ